MNNSCEKCKEQSISGDYCTLATSLNAKPMFIEDPTNIPEWCPKKNHKEHNNG